MKHQPNLDILLDDDDDESENEEQIVPLENQPASQLEFESLTNDLTDISLLPESKSLMSMETTTSIENSQFYEEEFSSITNQEIETNNFIEEQDYTSSIYPTGSDGDEIIVETVKFKTPETITMHMQDFKTLQVAENPPKTTPTDNEITMEQDTVAYHKNMADMENEEKVPIQVVTKQMIKYCEELKSLLYLNALKKDEKAENQKVIEKMGNGLENLETLDSFKEELVKANEEQSLDPVQECKHNYGKSDKKPEELDLAIYPTAIESSLKSHEDYNNRLKNLEPEVNGTACNEINQFELTKHDSRVINSNNNLSPAFNVTNKSNSISTNNQLIPLEDTLSSDSITAQSTISDSNNNNQSEDSLEQDILIPGNC